MTILSIAGVIVLVALVILFLLCAVFPLAFGKSFGSRYFANTALSDAYQCRQPLLLMP